MLKLLLVVAIIAAVTYLVTRAMQDRGPTSQPDRRNLFEGLNRLPKRPSKPSRPVAPDDDEEFLRDLDRKRLNPPDQDG